MRLEKYSITRLEEAFFVEKVLSLESIGKLLGAPSKRTIARKMDTLRCRASYSHAGRYYTLDECADYNKY